MSNLLEQASLVMIPSGYKEDVVYSEIPINGAGDLAFTRASNGTRINSQGFVETVPWNLFTYSEDFANADWIKVGSTISSNVLVAPNGTTTADKLVEDTSNGVHIALQISGERNVNSIYAFSVYAKAGERTKINLFNNGNGLGNANFDLSNGTATLIAGEFATIESVGNGWYRCVVGMQENSTVGNFNYHIRLLDASGSDSYTGNGTSGAYIWGAQVNLGTAKPYFPTTDRLNVPRLTYQNGGGGCPSLLLEKQSTNLVTYSEQLDNADWSKVQTSISANATTSPDGTQNADLVYPSVSGISFTFQQKLATIGTTYSQSIYVKAGGKNYCWMLDINGSIGARFDLINGTVVNNPSGNAKIQSVGNGWFRISDVGVATGSLSYVGISSADSASTNNTTVNGTDGVYAWGGQIEAGSYPTSYIPTTSSSATRVADDIAPKSLSSVGITSNYTLFFQLGQCVLSAAESWILQSSSGANTPFQIYGTTAILYTSAGYIYPFSFLTTNPNNDKVAVAYNGTNITVFWNGVKMGQWTATTEWANLTTLDLLYGISTQVQYREVALFNVGLSDADAISLTTL